MSPSHKKIIFIATGLGAKEEGALSNFAQARMQQKPNTKTSFYITTTLPYVNADPHIGFALELVYADIFARHHALAGEAVFFNTGTDEHGAKIYRKAQEAGVSPQEYVDEYAQKFKNLIKALDIWEGVNFIRTTDESHKKAAQEFWKRCDARGDIYKKNYKMKYCIGCELEKTNSELNEKGQCPLHPDHEIETINEENYFFKFSKYQKQLLGFYEKNPNFIIPERRFAEIKAFVGRGLQDFSISRLKEKMPWGVAVPGDSAHVMYVWFDALVNYISALEWPDNKEKFNNFWGTVDAPNAVQIAGKDNLRQQSAMWQAMLMSAELLPSKYIVIHGFITSGGQKMSKSLGNVVDPVKIIEEYGADALRYYLARHVHPVEDSDFTMEKFKEAYNANLANGLGNLAARILQMSSQYFDSPVDISTTREMPEVKKFTENFEFNIAMDSIWSYMRDLDGLIDEGKPFEVVKKSKKRAQLQVAHLVKELARITKHLKPFLPETSEKILTSIKANQKPGTLFPRKD